MLYSVYRVKISSDYYNRSIYLNYITVTVMCASYVCPNVFRLENIHIRIRFSKTNTTRICREKCEST